MKPCPNLKCINGLIPRKPDCDTGSDKKCPDCGGAGEVEEEIIFKVPSKRRKVNVCIKKRYKFKDF